MLTATYSPDDNKLRLYSSSRLDSATYERVKAAGFKWAPRQELFVAPMWTPAREDLLLELCGEIGDEDTSLVERAEERADRFGDYSDKRASDAESARKAVSAIADGIPFGQPILVGHHSERHARKDAERIENGMARAVKMWETSEYWKQRAAGALHHAKYKERPDVRARRIKGLEADKRKQERNMAESEKWLKLWTTDGLTMDQARRISDHCWLTVTPPNERGIYYTAYDVLRPDGERYSNCPAWTVEQVQEVARRLYSASIANCRRWLEHYENRLAYERAMLADAGGTAADKTGPEKGGACQCWASHRGGWSYIQKVNKVSVTVLDNWGNGGGNFTRTIPFDKLGAIMTAAQVAEARAEGRIVEYADGTGFALDGAVPKTTPKAPEPAIDAEKFQAMRDQLKAGVQIVTAPQLFPTPADLAARMVDLADIEPGMRVLEPSAGTGRIVDAILAAHEAVELAALEINGPLARALHDKHGTGKPSVYEADFLEWELGKFDRILMNPPFSNADDIKHIQHARSMLKPGGRLVAICANGPRQRAALEPIADIWEDLPKGTFQESGTSVNAALLVISG